MKTNDIIKRFMALFASNPRSSGRWNPERERMHVEHEPITSEVMADHLSGKGGCGGVPIQDDGTCTWAAIDLDNHGEDADLPIEDIESNARAMQMPLVMCRSKSGGVHCYLFMKKPEQAGKVRALLTRWAAQLGYAGAEVFPKQSRLYKRGGEMSYGNWINLPYFDADNTVRYAVVNGKKLAIDEFIEHAESVSLTDSEFGRLLVADHPEAPPCIQSIMANGVDKGHRNEAMYNVAVYFRKLDPNTAPDAARQMNDFIFTSPLPKAELQRTVASAMNPDYSYRCGQEVIKQYCNRDVCLTRKCGITEGEADDNAARDMLPAFADLVKYPTDPVRWEMKIDGTTLTNIDTNTLMNWKFMRMLIAEKLTRIVPMIKNDEWERMLAPMMATARIVDTPDDSSTSGLIRSKLREFVSKADLTRDGMILADRKVLLRGQPVVQVVDGERCVVFRGEDFVAYLKRTRSEELKGTNLWFAVRDIGVMHKKMRIDKDSGCNVWYIPIASAMLAAEPEQIDFADEIEL